VTFSHPTFLLLLFLLPPLWFWMRSAPDASLICLALKCVAYTAVVFALADPQFVVRVDKLAVTVLMDTSASMPRDSLQRGETLLRDLVARKSGAELRLITFAGHPSLQSIPTQADKVTIPQGLDPLDGNATDLESAIQLALSTFPGEGARRVVLVSDGNETRGHALTEASRAKQSGVPIFTFPAGGTAPLPVVVEAVESPKDVFAGERFTLALQLNSTRSLPVRLWATSNDQEIGSTTVDLTVGSNHVNLPLQTANASVDLFAVHVSSAGAQQVLFSKAVTVRRPHVLYINGGADLSTPLLDTLKRAQLEVQLATEFPVASAKQDWDAVLLDNYPDHQLSADELAAIESYVFKGGGLIFIAGDKNAKLAREPKTPLDKVLPVRAQPPPEKPVAIVLVLDKSGSMEGQKIEMVRAAAHASILPLRPLDKLGIISFDQDFDWVVPIGPASDLESKGELIDGIQAQGDTKIWQATQAAFDAIINEEASSRHIILLTDGETTYKVIEHWPDLERAATEQHVSISTIGIGDEVNRDLLEEIARTTSGKSHFVQNPAFIPQIINDEVQSPDDLAIQEKPVRPILIHTAEITDGIDFSRAPQLLGFVQGEAKEGAETILRVSGDKPLPLLVKWHYGLGSVIAFMSDAKPRWATPWVKWKSFGTLWPQMVRAVAHRDKTVRANVQSGEREGEMIVSYDVLPAAETRVDANDQTPLNLSLPGSPTVSIQGPGQTSQALPLVETVPGHYEARIASDSPGLYRITPSSSSPSLPGLGFFRESEETQPLAVNLTLLSEISRITGGRVHPSIDQLLAGGDSSSKEARSLWPFLLCIALMLNLLEVALRRGLFEQLVSRFLVRISHSKQVHS
jgi:Ca-activated chloride channel family protein